MLRGYYPSAFTAALLVVGLSGCASDSQESDPMTDASSQTACSPFPSTGIESGIPTVPAYSCTT